MSKKGVRGVAYTHLMRWEQFDVPDSDGRAWIKTLSKDEETGESTALVRFDPGFQQKKTTSKWPVDMYVLEGSMQSGSASYQKSTFEYRPPGVEFGPIESPEGVTRLVFRGDPKRCSKEPVFLQDIRSNRWSPAYDDPKGDGKSRGFRPLRKDAEGNFSVFMMATFQGGWRAVPDKAHIHDHIEEAYVIEGEQEDYLGEVNGHVVWVPGFYVCREPYESPHGDVVVLRTPVILMVRREWVGDETKIRDQDWKKFDVPVVEFAE